MPTYKYRCRTPGGRLQAGFVDAVTPDDAVTALTERGYEILVLEPYVPNVAERTISILNRVKAKDLVVLSRTLSVMMSASVPLVDSLKNISLQTQNPKLKQVLLDVTSEVEAGARLSDALERHPKIFSSFFVNMIRSGETSGQLEEILEYLADQQEKDYDLASKVRGAMMYPAFILFALVGVGFVMMSFVIPKLLDIFKEAEVELPLPTRFLIAVSGFFASFWWLILLLGIGGGVAAVMFVQTPAGRQVWDSLKIRIPILGRIYNRIYVVRFARSLATLIHGGVDQVSALEVVSGVVGNSVWKKLIFETIQEVNEGNSITTAFARSKFVPQIVVQMLAIGEDTGRLQEVLNRVADFFRREVDALVTGLVSLIEPIIIIILGVVVGFMVSAILLPMYSMSNAV
jgi:type II secretory pathway component PulF